MNKKRKKKKGLTLLELIIVLGLMGIVISLIFSVVNITQKKSQELDVKQELQHDGTMITESVMKNVLAAKKIESITEKDTSSGANVEDRNIISEIKFNFDVKYDGTTTFKPRMVTYKIDYDVSTSNSELKLIINGTKSEIEAGAIFEDQTVTVSNLVKSIKIENLKVKEFMKVGDMTEARKQLEKEKSIKLKILLADEYMGEEIVDEHIIELNLRNAK